MSYFITFFKSIKANRDENIQFKSRAVEKGLIHSVPPDKRFVWDYFIRILAGSFKVLYPHPSPPLGMGKISRCGEENLIKWGRVES